MTSGLAGEMESPILPISPFGMPVIILFHETPPSVVLYSADSGPPPTYIYTFRCRWWAAAYSTFGSRGSIWISLNPVFSLTHKLFFHVLPQFVLFYIPL